MSVHIAPERLEAAQPHVDRLAYAREFASTVVAFHKTLIDGGLERELAGALAEHFVRLRVRPAVFKSGEEQIID